MNKKDKGFFVAIFTCAIIGAMIGYGSYGTVQSAVLYAGYGAVVPILLLIMNG